MAATVNWPKAMAEVKGLVDLLMARYEDERGIHAETVIGAAAAVAGAYALRATTDLAPGDAGYVVSADADALLFGTGADSVPLTTVVLDFAEAAGLKPENRPDTADIRRRVAAAIGSSTFPPLSIPRGHTPREWSPNAVVRLRPELDRLFADKGLGLTDAAAALAGATGSLIRLAAPTLDPAISTLLALEIMIGVSRMRPNDREF